LKSISLLGATGSIGVQTLDVIRAHPEEFKLVAFSAGKNMEQTRRIIAEFQPKLISVLEEKDALIIQKEVGSKVDIVYGDQGLIDVATYDPASLLVNAVMGSVGLEPTLRAIDKNKTIALANKETLVTAGHLVIHAARENQVSILPVDSEHSAIYQCLQGEQVKNIDRLIITASGGSFRDLSREELENVTLEQALNHPNWSMGAKITIDSATMMNKGLEVIEAHWLFDMPYEQIDVLLHKESTIHSMVEFNDGSVMAQLGTPDMRAPIQYALTYPDRIPLIGKKRLRLEEFGQLHFEKMDYKRFYCLQLAIDAGKAGGSLPTVLNAANERAVMAFLNGKISFLQIETLIERALNRHNRIEHPDLQTIREVDLETRNWVESNL
jgi:1-deoxy-D-xylulose-5-phosphate reductoisomerase